MNTFVDYGAIARQVAQNSHLENYVGRRVAFIAFGRRHLGRVRKVADAYCGTLEIDSGCVYIVRENKLRFVSTEKGAR